MRMEENGVSEWGLNGVGLWDSKMLERKPGSAKKNKELGADACIAGPHYEANRFCVVTGLRPSSCAPTH